MLKRGDIETYQDPQDRRITMYRISKEKEENAKVQLVAEEIKARMLRLFEEVSLELAMKLLDQFELWLKEQGYGELARSVSRYEIVDRENGCVLRNRMTGHIIAVVHHGFPENKKKES